MNISFLHGVPFILSRALSPPIIGLNALHIIYLTNIGLLFVRIFFLLQPLGCKICRPLKNVSVLVLCRSFSHVSLCVSVLVFLFFILLLCILFFSSLIFRLLGIRRTVLRHLGSFRRNVFNGFDPQPMRYFIGSIYSY